MTKEQLYTESNKVDKVALKAVAKAYVDAVLACGEGLVERQVATQKLMDYLCDKAKIRRVIVRVVNKPQPHQVGDNGNLRSKTLGTYTVGREVITLYNLTAKTRKVVAIKTFLQCSLHEWVHHYDVTYLNYPTSYHTKGFYMRLSNLQSKCYAHLK